MGGGIKPAAFLFRRTMVTIEKSQDTLTDKPLLAKDRCDRCNAAAKVRVLMKDSTLELLFCGHHMKQNQEKLKEVAYFNPNWEDALQ